MLPAVALRAMRLAEDPDWDLQTLSATIRRDQGLASQFLSLANSAYFGARCTITTVERAINLVGIKRARSMLLAASLEGLHQNKTSNFRGKVLWEHALSTGCVSQLLAKKHKRCDSEEAFMAGLLHDVGRPVMDQLFTTRYAKVGDLVKSGDAESFLVAEQHVFGFDHADVGFISAKAWGFPPAFAEAVHLHHDPTIAQVDPILCATVSLANSMCVKAELGPDKQPELDLSELPSAEMLKLDVDPTTLSERLRETLSAQIED